jgi:hypothetical protein
MRYLCEFCDKILKDPLMDNSDDKPRYFCNKACKEKREEEEWQECENKIRASLQIMRMRLGLPEDSEEDAYQEVDE